MILHFQHDVEIARRRTVRPLLAFPGDAHARARIDTRRNPHVNRTRLLDSSASPAFRTLLFNCLSGSLTRGTRAADSEKSLLVVKLAAALALLACGRSRFRLGAGALAQVAQILTRNANLRRQAERRFLERQPHVVTQIGSALRPGAAAGS